MLGKSLTPTEASFSPVILAYGRRAAVAEDAAKTAANQASAAAIWSRMVALGVRPETAIVNNVLETRLRVLDKARFDSLEVLQQMRLSGVALDVISFNTALRGHENDGDLKAALHRKTTAGFEITETAKDVLEQLPSKHAVELLDVAALQVGNHQDDSLSHLIVRKSWDGEYTFQGRGLFVSAKHARQILTLMDTCGVKPNCITWRTILAIGIKVGIETFDSACRGLLTEAIAAGDVKEVAWLASHWLKVMQSNVGLPQLIEFLESLPGPAMWCLPVLLQAVLKQRRAVGKNMGDLPKKIRELLKTEFHTAREEVILQLLKGDRFRDVCRFISLVEPRAEESEVQLPGVPALRMLQEVLQHGKESGFVRTKVHKAPRSQAEINRVIQLAFAQRETHVANSWLQEMVSQDETSPTEATLRIALRASCFSKDNFLFAVRWVFQLRQLGYGVLKADWEFLLRACVFYRQKTIAESVLKRQGPPYCT